MEPDTAIGGPGRAFPATRRSVIEATRSGDDEERRHALEAIIAGYWKPVYKYVRIKWRATNEDAKDLTQGFFARAIQKGWFERYDPAKAKFRTYLRTCVDGHVANERKAARRMKRGGDIEKLSLDFEDAERELRRLEIPDDLDLDEFFYREWVRSLFGLVVDELRRRCQVRGKETLFALFERYDLQRDEAGRITYDELAAEHGLSATQVTNRLATVRRWFRELVLEKLGELCASDHEYRTEAQRLLGVEIEEST